MSTKPYEIQVSALISAPIAKIFETINDLNNFTAWSPFMKMDPKTQVKISSPGIGEGQSYDYTSKRMGTGRMTITGSYPNSLVVMKLEFLAPNNEVANSEFRLIHVGNEVEVTWTMSGERGLKDRIMVAMLGMDKMMTKHFANGLGALKAIVETAL
jgi:hypothetical protein